jgi:hypothetical protein
VKLPIQITLVPIVPVETEEHVVYNLDLIILVLVLWAGKVFIVLKETIVPTILVEVMEIAFPWDIHTDAIVTKVFLGLIVGLTLTNVIQILVEMVPNVSIPMDRISVSVKKGIRAKIVRVYIIHAVPILVKTVVTAKKLAIITTNAPVSQDLLVLVVKSM